MLKILLTIKVIDKIFNKSERKEIFEQLSKIIYYEITEDLQLTEVTYLRGNSNYEEVK